MINVAPATIANELDQRIQAKLFSSSHYCEESDPVVLNLFDDIQKLMKASAKQGHVLKGLVFQLCGDVEKARYHVENAGKIGQERSYVQSVLGSINVNFGYFSLAQKNIYQSADPIYGQLTNNFDIALSCGAFSCLNGFIDKANKMNLDLAVLPVDLVRRAGAILDSAGVTDAQIGAMLDAAGEVLREEKLFFVGNMPDFEVSEGLYGDAGCVFLRYALPVTPEEAARLFDRLAEKIVARIDPVPDAFYVSFRSAKWQ